MAMAALDTPCLLIGPVPFKDVQAMAALDTPCLLIGPVPFKDMQPEDDGSPLSSMTGTAPTTTTTPTTPTPTTTAPTTSAPTTTAADTQLRQYQGMWLPNKTITRIISVQPRFESRPGDVLLASPPKCGTTWLKALAFAAMARAAYPPSDADHPLRRLNPHECIPVMENLFSAGQEAKLEALPSPRLLHTHMHYALLPPSLADCKIVFVCREPKDMLVSMWHYSKSAGSNTPFSDLFEQACEGKNQYGPSWNQVLGYWTASRACTDKVMFLRYEEMLADPVGTVRQLARFLGVPFTAVEEAAGSPVDIADMCSIDALRGVALSAKKTRKVVKVRHETLFRKGVVGDWVNHMTPEMARRFDAIVEDKLQGSGLTFTSAPTLT